jgi:hypothetical protein
MSALAGKKKEMFAQAVAAGAAFVDAYKATRDCTKMQPSTIRSNAKKLAREPAVAARIQELRESKEGEFPRSNARAGAKGESSRESSASPGPGTAPPTRDEPANPERAAQEPKPRGRPTVYAEETATVILARLAAGEPLRTICRTDGMPDESTVRAWALDPNHPFAARYALAREMGFFSMADELLEIADDARNDFMERMTRSGEVETVVNEEVLARSRMRIATRQWLLAKALPQTFGDRLEQNLTVEDITPRPQDPGREAMRAAIRRVREAAFAYQDRIAADAAAEKAKALPPAGKSNGSGG